MLATTIIIRSDKNAYKEVRRVGDRGYWNYYGWVRELADF